MGNPQTTTELGWLAGFIEADGSLQFMIQEKKNGRLQIQPRLQIGNTEKELIEECGNIIKNYLNIVPHFSHAKQNGNNKRTCYRVEFARQAQMLKALPKLIPFLRGRKKQIAEHLLQFSEERILQNREKTWGGYVDYTPSQLNRVYLVLQMNSVGVSETIRRNVERLIRRMI